MKLNYLRIACFGFTLGLLGCGSPEGGLVTDQGSMTLEELQEMQAKSLSRERSEEGEEDGDDQTDGL